MKNVLNLLKIEILIWGEMEEGIEKFSQILEQKHKEVKKNYAK